MPAPRVVGDGISLRVLASLSSLESRLERRRMSTSGRSERLPREVPSKASQEVAAIPRQTSAPTESTASKARLRPAPEPITSGYVNSTSSSSSRRSTNPISTEAPTPPPPARRPVRNALALDMPRPTPPLSRDVDDDEVSNRSPATSSRSKRSRRSSRRLGDSELLEAWSRGESLVPVSKVRVKLRRKEEDDLKKKRTPTPEDDFEEADSDKDDEAQDHRLRRRVRKKVRKRHKDDELPSEQLPEAVDVEDVASEEQQDANSEDVVDIPQEEDFDDDYEEVLEVDDVETDEWMHPEILEEGLFEMGEEEEEPVLDEEVDVLEEELDDELVDEEGLDGETLELNGHLPHSGSEDVIFVPAASLVAASAVARLQRKAQLVRAELQGRAEAPTPSASSRLGASLAPAKKSTLAESKTNVLSANGQRLASGISLRHTNGVETNGSGKAARSTLGRRPDRPLLLPAGGDKAVLLKSSASNSKDSPPSLRRTATYEPPHAKRRRAEEAQWRSTKEAWHRKLAEEDESGPQPKKKVGPSMRQLERSWQDRLEHRGSCCFNPLQAEGVSVTSDCLRAQCDAAIGSTCTAASAGIKGLPLVMGGRYQYEVELLRACSLTVGWSAALVLPSASSSGGGFARRMLAFSSVGELLGGDGSEPQSYGRTFGRPGDIVGALLDWPENASGPRLGFTLNGRDLGLAFDLRSEGVKVPPLQLHICQGLGKPFRVMLRGASKELPLRFPIPGFRPLSSVAEDHFCPFRKGVEVATALSDDGSQRQQKAPPAAARRLIHSSLGLQLPLPHLAQERLVAAAAAADGSRTPG